MRTTRNLADFLSKSAEPIFLRNLRGFDYTSLAARAVNVDIVLMRGG